MASLGQHESYIIASYAVTFIILCAVVAWLVIDGRRQRELLARLEASGGRRGGRTSVGDKGAA
ncbi:MAG TPA: heme exporter protein CcmD [Hyphomicrobiaceae bacterium]|nr:heme exporter protein CcmD [Hyphomicrobiaceae bacterium]